MNNLYAFISRHEPTQRQHELAAEQGITLRWIGDADAFSVRPSWVRRHGDFDGVIVVHPAAAMRLNRWMAVGVFENANRAPEGERPQFEAKALHLWPQMQEAPLNAHVWGGYWHRKDSEGYPLVVWYQIVSRDPRILSGCYGIAFKSWDGEEECDVVRKSADGPVPVDDIDAEVAVCHLCLKDAEITRRVV